MISICIPTYNRLPFLKQCINSIFEKIGDYPYEIIVADGGSTDGTIDYLKQMDNIMLIEQGKLTGAIKATNACFKKAKGDFVYFINDDFEIKSEVVIKSCKMMEKESDIGIIAPKIQEPRYGNLPGVTVKKYGILLAKVWIFRHSVLKEIGYFDEGYRTYCTDDDAFLSVMKLRYTTMFSKEVAVIHHRVRDEKINKARAANVHPEHVKKDLDHLKQKWKKKKSKIFQAMCNEIWKSKALSKMTPRWLYDSFLENVVLFKDEKYKHVKDFYLAQKYPAEILTKGD